MKNLLTRNERLTTSIFTKIVKIYAFYTKTSQFVTCKQEYHFDTNNQNQRVFHKTFQHSLQVNKKAI